MSLLDLPPLQLLLAFDAAGRLGSFKAAAAQLHLTPSAISHQLKELELALGTQLFARDGRAVRLTAAGALYLREIQQALAAIASATCRLRSRANHRVVRLSMDNFIACEFMLPRLAAFRERFPSVELSLIPSTRLLDFAAEPLDAAIRIGARPWPGLVDHALGEAWVAPVCSRARAEALHTVAELSAHPLIEVRDQRRGWSAFLRKHGASPAVERLYFDGYLETMRAAEQSLGVAFGVFPMTTSWVNDGSLCVPLALRSRLAAEVCFVYREADAADPLYAELACWLRAQYEALPTLPSGRIVRGEPLRPPYNNPAARQRSIQNVRGATKKSQPRKDPARARR